MSKLYVTFTYSIQYPESFPVDTNMEREDIPGVIEAYLQDIMDSIGDGKDDNLIERYDVYNIRLEIDPTDKTITCNWDDKGSKELIAGILMYILSRLTTPEESKMLTRDEVIRECVNVVIRRYSELVETPLTLGAIEDIHLAMKRNVPPKIDPRA